MVKVVIVMGLILDWFIMQQVVKMLKLFGVEFEVKVVFVYRILNLLVEFVEVVVDEGFSVIIVGVGGVVYFLGMIVVYMYLLVFGCLVKFKVFNGLDFLFFIV